MGAAAAAPPRRAHKAAQVTTLPRSSSCPLSPLSKSLLLSIVKPQSTEVRNFKVHVATLPPSFSKGMGKWHAFVSFGTVTSVCRSDASPQHGRYQQ